MSFFNVLLRASKTEKNWFLSRAIPREVFSTTPSMANWIYSYVERYRELPSLQAAQERFPNFDFSVRSKETVQAALQRVLDSYQFAEMQRVVLETKKKIDSGSPINDAVAFMRQKTAVLGQFANECIDIPHTSDVAVERYKQRLHARKSGAPFRMNPSPWPEYNKLVQTTEPGEHIVLAARTSIGKTWIALHWATYLARAGASVLIRSFEMPAEQVNDRIEAIRFGLPYSFLRNGKMHPRTYGKWMRDRYAETKRPMTGKITVSGLETMNASDMTMLTRKIEDIKPDFVIVDGAYLIYPPEAKKQDDLARWRLTADLMKKYAKMYKTSIMSVVQSNRSAEDEAVTKPKLSNVYGSDAWAQSADVLMLIGGERGSSFRSINVAKVREAPTGDFNICFQLDPPCFDSNGIVPTSGNQSAGFAAAAII